MHKNMLRVYWALFCFGDVIRSYVTQTIQLRILFIVVWMALCQSHASRGRAPEPEKYAWSMYVQGITIKPQNETLKTWTCAELLGCIMEEMQSSFYQKMIWHIF